MVESSEIATINVTTISMKEPTNTGIGEGLRMLMNRLFQFSLLASLFLFVNAGLVLAKPSGLPLKIQNYLSRAYPGWRQTGTATYCFPKFKQSMVSGDFDGDGQRDYTVKFTAGTRAYIVAFVARGADYQPFVLMSATAQEITHVGLSIGRKGNRSESEEGRVTILRNDAPLIGACESEACFYVYRNGHFQCE